MNERRRSRGGRFLLGLAALGAVALVALLIGFLVFQHRVRARGDALVREAITLSAATFDRPSLSSPSTPGTFGEAVAPLLPRLLDLQARWDAVDADQMERCMGILDGTMPFSQIPGPCAELLEEERPLVAEVLAATHAGQGAPPEGLRVFTDPAKRWDAAPLVAIDRVASLTGIEVRQALSRGDTTGAVTLCLDGLALGRDVGGQTGLMGARLGALMVHSLFPACAAALDAAPPELDARASTALRVLRASWSPLTEALREDSTEFELKVFHGELTEAQRQALPPRAQAFARAARAVPAAKGLGQVLFGAAWLEIGRLEEGVAAALDTPPSDRQARLGELLKESKGSRNPIPRLWERDWEREAERDDGRKARLNLLAALAVAKVERARSGQWPEAVTLDPPAAPGMPITVRKVDGTLELSTGAPGKALSLVATGAGD